PGPPTLSLHDALPISRSHHRHAARPSLHHHAGLAIDFAAPAGVRWRTGTPAVATEPRLGLPGGVWASLVLEGDGRGGVCEVSLADRKSTRLNSSHDQM